MGVESVNKTTYHSTIHDARYHAHPYYTEY